MDSRRYWVCWGSHSDQAHVAHKPRLLSDNGSSYVSGELAEWLDDKKMGHVRGGISPTNSKQDRAMASNLEELNPAGKLLLPGRPGSAD